MKEIMLTQGQKVLVDDEDYEELSQYKWGQLMSKLAKTTYARRGKRINGERVTILMHRVVMNAPEGMEVDHRDGNGLNNQKSNLRLATVKENRRNRGYGNNKTGYTGVCPSENGERYKAKIKHEGKVYLLGTHDTPEEAALAYNDAAIMYFGEFAKLNDVPNEDWLD